VTIVTIYRDSKSHDSTIAEVTIYRDSHDTTKKA